MRPVTVIRLGLHALFLGYRWPQLSKVVRCDVRTFTAHQRPPHGVLMQGESERCGDQALESLCIMVGDFQYWTDPREHRLELHSKCIAELADRNVNGDGENGFDNLWFREVLMKSAP